MRRGLLLISATCAFLLAAACGDGAESADATNPLAERWLRLGEEPQTSISVYAGALPPNLVDLLNQDARPNADPEDLLSLPVHPEGELLGSYVMRMTDGVHLIWLIYEVAADARDIEATIERQLDESPWQATNMQANPTLTVVQFQSTTSGDIEGSAVVQSQPGGAAFTITVEREGAERSIEIPRRAYIPVIEAAIDNNLNVTRVDPGGARLAGLEENDRIVAVGETNVSTRRDLAGALRNLGDDGVHSTALTYIVQVQPAASPDEEPFVLPPSRQLPTRFPARDVWDSFTVVEYRWLSVAAGRAFEAGMLGTESASVTATNVRAALETAGWQVVDDRPSGFATILDVVHEGEGLIGSVQIDAFPRDQDYTLVVVQMQSAQ